jgi:FKBP-type peptidyl-prolyl cis-trans isomerase FklB
VLSFAGTLSDGTVFDSSRDRGEPTEFVLNQVIKGWQEGAPRAAQLPPSSRRAPARNTARRAPDAGLALMKPGSRAKLTIPAELAYGPMAMGDKIPANSALCFDVELIEVKEAGGFKFPF